MIFDETFFVRNLLTFRLYQFSDKVNSIGEKLKLGLGAYFCPGWFLSRKFSPFKRDDFELPKDKFATSLFLFYYILLAYPFTRKRIHCTHRLRHAIRRLFKNIYNRIKRSEDVHEVIITLKKVVQTGVKYLLASSLP